MAAPRSYALLTGGGTGGHVYPALALAEELVRRGHRRHDVRFVGATRGLEATEVPRAGFEVDLLPGRGLRRSLSPSAVVANVVALWWALAAFVRAWRILGRHRPRVVVGVGGYAAVPCTVAARLRRIPVVVHEQNAAPGLANRLAVRLGGRAAVALPGTPLRGAVVVGNPVRRAMTEVRRAPDADRALVLVFGGSLGARRINEAAAGLYDRWRHRADRRVHHVSGRRDFEAVSQRLAGSRQPGDVLEYELVDYESRMEEWYSRCSVALTRAGAVTVAELACAGVPAVIVPLPGAPADHQTRNALTLVDAGGAVLLPDAECTTERLADELDRLLADPARLAAMSRAVSSLARPDAPQRLADLVEEVAGG